MTAQVSFYSVPLVCEAASQIGCGCKAKPRLAALDGQVAVLRTWLHQAGDLLAVEWQHALPADERLALVRSVVGDVTELTDPPRSQVLERISSFCDPDRWYRRDTIDELSEQEARVIANRVISHLSESFPLPGARALELQLREALCTVLVCEDDLSMEVRRDMLLDKAYAVVSEHLPAQGHLRAQAFITRSTLGLSVGT